MRCYDAPEEARQIAEALLSSVELGGRLRDHAVLMRASHHSDLLELELTARRIPFMKYGGLKFLEAAHVKDFLAALRVLDNPSDEIAWFRLLRLHRGVGPGQRPGHAGAGAGRPRRPQRASWPPRRARRGSISPTRCASSMTPPRRGRSTDQVTTCVSVLKPLLQHRYPRLGRAAR